MYRSRPSSPSHRSRPARPASPFGLIPFPTGSPRPFPSSSPSDSPSLRRTPLPSSHSPSPRAISRPSTPAPLSFPVLPELGLKIPVPPSPIPRSQKVSLWIDRLPRRGKDDVEREVKMVFEGAMSSRRVGMSRSKSVGNLQLLSEQSVAGGGDRTKGKEPDNLVWWGSSATKKTNPPPLSTSTSSSLHSRSASAFSIESSMSTAPSGFYKRFSQVSTASNSTLTPSSSTHSSPSTPSLSHSAPSASSDEEDEMEDEEQEDLRTANSSTPTPRFPPSDPISPVASAIPRPTLARLGVTERPRPSTPAHLTMTLKRRSTTGDLLGQYLVFQEATKTPEPVVEKMPEGKVERKSSLLNSKMKGLPWRLGMWRREK